MEAQQGVGAQLTVLLTQQHLQQKLPETCVCLAQTAAAIVAHKCRCDSGSPSRHCWSAGTMHSSATSSSRLATESSKLNQPNSRQCKLHIWHWPTHLKRITQSSLERSERCLWQALLDSATARTEQPVINTAACPARSLCVGVKGIRTASLRSRRI